MRVTINQVIRSTEALNALAVSKQPVKIAWRISRVLRMLEPEVKAFNEARLGLINQHAEVIEDQFRVAPEKVSVFTTALQALLDEEIELAITPIEIDALSGDITAQDIASLEWLLVESNS